MPYDATEPYGGGDATLGRLMRARERLGQRRNWLAGKYFEEDSRGYRYCVLGAISDRPAEDGCMAEDAVGQGTAIWLAGHITGVRMPFEEASRVVYNYNDSFAALDCVSQTIRGLMFMTRHRRIDGYQRILDMLDESIEARRTELAADALRVAP
jgi:hypothetical protein